VQFIDEHPHCKAFLGQKPTFWQNLTFRGIKRVNWAYTCMKLRVLSHHTLKSIEGLLAVALIPKRAFIRAHLRQNPKITRRMAIVSFCNQCKAHYLATSRESRRVVSFSRVAGAGIWLRQESIRHILASPGYAPGTIAVNVTWMERGFNAGQTHCSIYPSIFNRLRAIARYLSEIATFSYPLTFNTPVEGVSIGISG